MRRKAAKEYWEMNTDELRQATQEFDKEFVADKAKPLTAEMKARWDRAKAEGSLTKNGRKQQTIEVHLDKLLLERCSVLAKKKRLSRDALIARGLRALLDAEGV